MDHVLVWIVYSSRLRPLLLHHKACLLIKEGFFRHTSRLLDRLWQSPDAHVELVACLNLIRGIGGYSLVVPMWKVGEVQPALEVCPVTHLVLEAHHLVSLLVSCLGLRERWWWQRSIRTSWISSKWILCIAHIEIWIWLRDQLGWDRIIVLRCVTRCVLHCLRRPEFIWVHTTAQFLPDLGGCSRRKLLNLTWMWWRRCCLNNLNIGTLSLREILLIDVTRHPLFDLNY